MALNPRYKNYARVNGNTPAKQLKIDKEKFKGGCMIGFIFFIQEHLAKFKLLKPSAFLCGRITDDKGFDIYLDNLLKIN